MDSVLTTSAVVSSVEDRSENVRILKLAPASPFAFRAGQYVRIGAENHDSRAFSLASRPEKDGTLTLHVRNTGTGLSAHLSRLQIGAELTVEGPFGTMDVKHARARPVLMVAGGTGIAPMLAMMQEILRLGLTEEGITLVYGARTQADIYCRRELDALVSSGEVALHEAIGEDTPDRVLARGIEDLCEYAVYLCGPPAMVSGVREILHMRGAKKPRIFADDWSKEKV